MTVPSGPQRMGDLPALAHFFLGSLAPGRALRISEAALELLARHRWPGNVRELRNVLEHAVAVSSGPVLLPQHLPRDVRELAEGGTAEPPPLAPALAAWLDEKLKAGETYQQISEALEAMALRHLLGRFDNKPTVLARETKMNRVTLRRKCRDFLRN